MKAVPAAGLVYYRDRLKICYRAKTSNKIYLINLEHYGQTGDVRNGHLIVNGGGKNPPNPFNAKIKELLKIDGIQYTRGARHIEIKEVKFMVILTNFHWGQV
jgi:hypothetical protein